MSGAQLEEPVRSAIPLADLSKVDEHIEGSLERLGEVVQKVRPADLGRDLCRRPIEHGCRLLEASDDRRGAAMLRACHPVVAAKVLSSCDPGRAARVLDFMPSDHQISILGAMGSEPLARIQGEFAPADKQRVDRVLAYNEASVARLMTPKVWYCERTKTVGDALRRLQEREGAIEVAQNCYIVDSGKLVGVVPLRTWLVLLFVAETATGTVLRHFEDELAKVVALSFFIPLLIGTGGNAGSQTVSTIIRALAIGEVRLRDALRVLLKEASAGVALGLLLGSIAFGRALLWGVGYDLAACVGFTVLIVCTWANTVGAVIPLAASRVGIDPTVISGPLITTLVDASGLFIYLSVAHLLVAQLQH